MLRYFLNDGIIKQSNEPTAKEPGIFPIGIVKY